MATFNEKLQAKWAEGKFVCVGLDSDIEKIPKCVFRRGGASNPFYDAIVGFNTSIVDATKDLVCAYKPNSAFYEAHGASGMDALEYTVQYIHKVAPDVPVILDAKRADIGNTNIGYVDAAFRNVLADALTVHPYLGEEALRPFLDWKEKGIIVLCRTSNKGGGEFQDCKAQLPTLYPGGKHEEFLQFEKRIGYQLSETCVPFYQYVAFRVAEHWNTNGNCALVVGATYPEELAQVRRIVGDMPILIPGIGAQGGDVEATVKAGMDSYKQGMIINSSRGIIFASSGADFAEAARRETENLHSLINQYRN